MYLLLFAQFLTYDTWYYLYWSALRYDSLVQLLTFANVHAGCTVLLTDTYSGLVTKAVLERLGHRCLGGRLITFFHGTSPPIVDVALAQESPPVCSKSPMAHPITSIVTALHSTNDKRDKAQQPFIQFFPFMKQKKMSFSMFWLNYGYCRNMWQVMTSKHHRVISCLH